MTARNGETSRRRGKARDDKEVLAEAHAPPAAARRGQVYATGEAREGRDVFRTTRFYGMVFVTIAEQYVESHAPVPCDACKEAVYKHSEAGRDHKNPFAILAQLEKPGLLQVDDGARDSDRLPRVDTVLVELDDGTVLWPKPAEPAAARKPSGASDLSGEAFAAALRSRFAGREFTSRDVLTEIEGAGKSTVYDRLRRYREDGTLEMVGGTVGSHSNPPRLRFTASVPAVAPEPAVAPAVTPRIKSKDEIGEEIASLGAQIEEAERAARERRLEEIRAAEARVTELEAELETARARLREAEASRPEPEGIDALVERQRSLRALADNYELLIKSD